MCLIAKMDKRADLPEYVAKHAQERNADGWGFMFAHDGRVIAQRGMGDYAEFRAAYDATVPDDVKVAVHWRMATRGAKTVANCHPFKVLDRDAHGQDVFLMHNGPQIARKCNGDAKRSDTREFAEDWLRPMLLSRPRFLRSPTFRKWLEEVTSERVLILEGCGKWHTFNADKWNKRDGVAYSNTYSLPPDPNAPKTDYYSSGTDWWNNDGWVQTESGAWRRKTPYKEGTSVSTVRKDGAGRIIPEGQDKPSSCPNRGGVACRVGCKVGSPCVAPESKVVKLRKSKTKEGPRDAEQSDDMFWNVWDKAVLRTMSDTEIFNLVIQGPEDCERFLRLNDVTFARGYASRSPENATDLVLDVLCGNTIPGSYLI